MRAPRSLALVLCLFTILSGCLGGDDAGLPPTDDAAVPDVIPYLGYVPADPDQTLKLVQESIILPGAGVTIHGRVVRPEGDGPFPVIIQFTPYTAPGRNAIVNNLIEPAAHDATGKPLDLDGSYVKEFVRRGYAFVFADVRGTGDSSGCLDLRGPKDIADLHHLIEHFGTADWSNGKVGFIGASYPGSTSHMAALAGNPHLAAVVPIVASTSFYHYHHNDGVPYNGNHALGGTNSGYTAFAAAPTVNPQSSNYASRHIEEVDCPHFENMVEHGGMDQTGSYYDWWQDRNLRPLVDNVTVPVLMAQGLADWNVKPDHIAEWYNALTVNKTLIAGQWGHQAPEEAKEAYGAWWDYVTAFFDTYLQGIETGMFGTDVAWVQDTDGAWHRSANFPLRPEEREEIVFHLTADGALADASATTADALEWNACPRDRHSKGAMSNVGDVPQTAAWCAPAQATALSFESEPFAADTLLSGVPLLNATFSATSGLTHLVWVLERIDAAGNAQRENYGYLNPVFRNGIDNATDVPTDAPYTATIDGYPQEDTVKKGERLRLTIRSHDDRRTIEAFEAGVNTLHLGSATPATLTLPVRPADLQGVRLTPSASD